MTDANGRTLRVGDLVQIDPAHDDVFGGCFMVVTELKSWGVQGYVPALESGPTVAYYRCPSSAMVWTGSAEWTVGDLTEEDDE